MSMNSLLIAILWVIVGFWIAYKRNWYTKWFDGVDSPPASLAILVCVVFAPVSLIIAFVREMLIDKWNND